MADPGSSLGLRRANVTARLPPGSRLLLLDASDVLRRLGDREAAVLCAPIADRAMLPGVLRAAREADAVLGLSAPFVPGDRDAPARFFAEVCGAAQQVQYQGPIFLQAGPIRLSPADGANAARLADHVFRYLDAGFTLVSLDAARLDPREAAKVCAEVARPAVEANVSIEVAPPRVDGPRGSKGFLTNLSREGIAPRFLKLDPVGLSLGSEPSALVALAQAALMAGTLLSTEDASGLPYRAGRALACAGLRKFDAAADFGRAALAGQPAALREALADRALAAGLPVSDLVALRGGDPADLGAAERVEALAYLQAQGWLEALGSAGTAGQPAGADFG
jgi:hypothetical protein